uniref:Uncharacterized protein n=1 Tax=Oryza barthii TaxID=65489 RepID=A0A0D3GPM9_9ORYZ
MSRRLVHRRCVLLLPNTPMLLCLPDLPPLPPPRPPPHHPQRRPSPRRYPLSTLPSIP